MSEPIKTLVVGGENVFIERVLKANLACFSKDGRTLQVAYHWGYKIPDSADIPRDCELVFVVIGQNSHSLSEPAMAMARARGVPLVVGHFKLAESVAPMERAGFTYTPKGQNRMTPAAAAPPAPAAPQRLTPEEVSSVARWKQGMLRQMLCEDPSFTQEQAQAAIRARLTDAFPDLAGRGASSTIQTDQFAALRRDLGINAAFTPPKVAYDIHYVEAQKHKITPDYSKVTVMYPATTKAPGPEGKPHRYATAEETAWRDTEAQRIVCARPAATTPEVVNLLRARFRTKFPFGPVGAGTDGETVSKARALVGVEVAQTGLVRRVTLDLDTFHTACDRLGVKDPDLTGVTARKPPVAEKQPEAPAKGGAKEITKTKMEWAREALCRNPALPSHGINRIIRTRVSKELPGASDTLQSNYIASLRKELGIYAPSGGKEGEVRVFVLDRPVFESACSALGITPDLTNTVWKESKPAPAPLPPKAKAKIAFPFTPITIDDHLAAMAQAKTVVPPAPTPEPAPTPVSDVKAALHLLVDALVAAGYDLPTVTVDVVHRKLSGQKPVVVTVMQTVEIE